MNKGEIIVFIASDHAGFDTKELLVNSFAGKYSFVDLGANSRESVDYNDYAKLVVEKVLECDGLGILICMTGIGMSISANRHKGIRAALCRDIETAVLSRQHNDANLLVLSARAPDNLAIAEAFLSTEFSEEERHISRVKKLG